MTLGMDPIYAAYAKRAISKNLTVDTRPRSKQPAVTTWFSKALHALLDETGVQKGWLADRLDVDPGTVSSWLWEGRIPKRKVRSEIEDLLNREGYFLVREPEEGDGAA